MQTFSKYSNPYLWNKVDHLILDNEEQTLNEEMKSRCLSFGLVPYQLCQRVSADEHKSRFRRLLDYLGKLCGLPEDGDLGIKIAESNDDDNNDEDHWHYGTIAKDNNRTKDRARRSTARTKSFLVDLRKRQSDRYEWYEVVLDERFSPGRFFHIVLKWLVASAPKIETQIQLLQRRCTQYGLQLLPFPHLAMSANLVLNPVRQWSFGRSYGDGHKITVVVVFVSPFVIVHITGSFCIVLCLVSFGSLCSHNTKQGFALTHFSFHPLFREPYSSHDNHGPVHSSYLL